MTKQKNYYKYTDYHKEPAGLRKLDFMVEQIERRSEFQDKKSVKILDIGCGRGNISMPLASLSYQVTGIDLDANSIEEINKKNNFNNAEFRVQDANTLDVNDKYDFIIASEVVEHIKEPEKFLKFLKNILNEKGFLIITIPNGKSLEERIRKFTTHNKQGLKIKKTIKQKLGKEDIVQSHANSPHLHFFSLKKIEKLITNSGYEIIACKNQASMFKEAYYLFLRFVLKRGSWLFRMFNKIDNFLADITPQSMADGWMFVIKKTR
jgi:cyclopropane fatty-acyl-phospholipid synthase-like methyltransferase